MATKEYRQTHRAELSSKQREYRKTHPKECKESKLKSKYGLSLSEFDNLLLAQNNRCAICNQPLDLQNPNNVHIDHSHLTRIVRGILCRNCNLGIGFFRDNPEYLRNAIKYLERD